ncbi:glycosyltransferase [Streptomyces sp. NPDC101151]|uniref:glycosyltransferase n=1 Tax=Streptomyces sp. NPDC101151 TaxID=3366115 RepID=UPI0038112D1C
MRDTVSMPVRNIFLVGIDVDSMGGSQRVLHTLAQGMGERGHRVELIGIRPSPEPFRYNREPSYRHTTLYPEPAQPVRSSRTLTQRLSPARRLAARRARADRDLARVRLTASLSAVREGYLVIGSPWAADWILSLGWQHLKGIGQYHESFMQAQASANLKLILRHYPLLDKMLVLSQDDAVQFRNRRMPNVSVMPNPLPFCPDEAAPLDTLRLGAVGRLDPVKRLDRLIEAFATVAPERPGWELHLFGEGPMEDDLRAEAVRLGVGERVLFRGTISDIRTAYQELSLVCVTSEREGRPMSLAESSACGVPCVSFNLSGGVRDLVEHEKTGILVLAGDVPAFAAALGELMDDHKRRLQYGAAAREHMSALALPNVLDRWERLFIELDR